MNQPGSEPIYTVLVNFSYEGFHCWLSPPDNRRYLRNDHRHLFKFKVELWVEVHDREIELHDLKESCLKWASQYYKGTKTASCEFMAEHLLRHLRSNWQPFRGRVECWEDGEVGGSCEMSWLGEEN